MDTSAQTALTKGHENLSNDLANLSQLIEPINDRALALLYRVQRRLKDIEKLVTHTGTTAPRKREKSEPLQRGDIMTTRNPLIADNDAYQTIHNVTCVLSYLQAVRPIEGCECPDSDTDYGLWLVFDAVRGALDFEKERVVEKQREAAAEKADA